MARPPAIQTETAVRVVLNAHSVGFTDDQFFRLCRDNRDLRIEMTAQKELIIMSCRSSKFITHDPIDFPQPSTAKYGSCLRQF
jgi:hypothetical protein